MALTGVGRGHLNAYKILKAKSKRQINAVCAIRKPCMAAVGIAQSQPRVRAAFKPAPFGQQVRIRPAMPHDHHRHNY
jgi:hypothetical protein